MPISRTHWGLALFALVALRLVVGWHFYSEGISKLKNGDFSTEGFFYSANGPAAEFYRSLIDDNDGRMRMGLVQFLDEQGEVRWKLDPLVTEETWRGFVYRASAHYGFSDAAQLKLIAQRRQILIDRQAAIIDASDPQRAVLSRRIAEESKKIQAVKDQKQRALQIVNAQIERLQQFLSENETEILIFFRSADRLNGFQKDGSGRSKVARDVDSLRQQTLKIAADRRRDSQPWLDEVNSMWGGLEADINALAIDDQTARGYLRIERPDQPKYSLLGFVNKFVPWFDTIVGGLLLLGLFTRFAAIAAAVFLIGIISTQPPFFPGSAATIYQSIEVIALFVLFATCAGRIAGLDALIYRDWNRSRRSVTQPTEVNP